MKRNSFLIVLMTFLLLITGCSGDKDTAAYDLAGKTYYNTIDEYGNTDHSQIWFGKDGSFVMKDNFAEGYYEITGTWSIKENVCTLDVSSSGVGNYKTILFEIQDNDTIILKTSLAGSRSNSTFTTTEIKGDVLTFGTYYNYSQNIGDLDYIELEADGSFMLVNRYSKPITETKGTWAVKDNTLILSYRKDGTEAIFEMLIKDPKNLVLQNDMGSSATGDVFSIDPPATDEPDPIVIPCTGLKASETSYKVPVNSSPFYLGVKALPSDCTEQIYFTSSNDSIVKVDNIGNVTPGSKVGKTIINVTCGSQSMTINFETVDITASSIDLDPAVLTLSMKEGATVKAKVLPSTASQKVKWTSSDPSIATVDVNGYVIGQFLGKAKITATAENGVSSHINVYVDGETVIFEMQDHVSVKASSGQKIPYKAYLIINSGEYYNKQDVTLECEFHTAFTSALDIDGNGNVYAKGAVYDTVDIPVYFTWNDGSSLNVTSQTFIVHVEK